MAQRWDVSASQSSISLRNPAQTHLQSCTRSQFPPATMRHRRLRQTCYAARAARCSQSCLRQTIPHRAELPAVSPIPFGCKYKNSVLPHAAYEARIPDSGTSHIAVHTPKRRCRTHAAYSQSCTAHSAMHTVCHTPPPRLPIHKECPSPGPLPPRTHEQHTFRPSETSAENKPLRAPISSTEKEVPAEEYTAQSATQSANRAFFAAWSQAVPARPGCRRSGPSSPASLLLGFDPNSRRSPAPRNCRRETPWRETQSLPANELRKPLPSDLLEENLTQISTAIPLPHPKQCNV